MLQLLAEASAMSKDVLHAHILRHGEGTTTHIRGP